MIENFRGATVREMGDGRRYHQGYLLHEVIGKGGQGAVYRATDLSAKDTPDETVAVKLHLPFRDEAQQRAFENEGHRTTRWRHENLLPTFSYGLGRITRDGLTHEYPVAVTDYVKDGSLAQRIQKAGRLPLAEAVELTCQAAQGVHYAHERGVLHRDLKPANFLLERRERNIRLMVGDFGIAVKLHEPGADTFSTQLAMGSLPYMSPEHARGKAVRQSDVYSLAVIAYELSTGRRPFTSSSTIGYVKEHEGTPPPAFEHIRDIKMSPALEAIEPVIQKSLSKRPQDRHGSMGDFGQDLKDAYESAHAQGRKATAVIDLAATEAYPDRAVGRWRVGPEKTKQFTESDLRWLDAYDDVIARLGDALNANGDLVERIEELQHAVAQVTESRDDALAKNKAQAKEIDTLRNRITEFESTIGKLTASRDKAEQTAKARESLLALAKDEVGKLKEEIARLRAAKGSDTPGSNWNYDPPLVMKLDSSARPDKITTTDGTLPDAPAPKFTRAPGFTDAPAPKFTRALGMAPPPDDPPIPTPRDIFGGSRSSTPKTDAQPKADAAQQDSKTAVAEAPRHSRRKFLAAGLGGSALACLGLGKAGKLDWIGDRFDRLEESNASYETRRNSVAPIARELLANMQASKNYVQVAETARHLAALDPKTAQVMAEWLMKNKQYLPALQVYAVLPIKLPDIYTTAPYRDAYTIINNSSSWNTVEKYTRQLLDDGKFELVGACAPAIAKKDAGRLRSLLLIASNPADNVPFIDKISWHRSNPKDVTAKYPANKWLVYCAEALAAHDPQAVKNSIDILDNYSLDDEAAAYLAIQCAPLNPDITHRAVQNYLNNGARSNNIIARKYFMAGMSLAGHKPLQTKEVLKNAPDENNFYRSWLSLALNPAHSDRRTAALAELNKLSKKDDDSYWVANALIAAYAKPM